MANLKAKITTKSILGDVKKLVYGGSITGPTAVMRIAGIASKLQHGQSDYGDWVKFKGQFNVINLLTGEQTISGTCMLPGVASELLEGAMLGAETDNSVEFAFDIILVPDDTSMVGYRYEAKPLIEAKEDDPLLRLMASLPALEKPKKATKAA